MKKLISILLILAMVLSATVTGFAFTDISGDELSTAVYGLQSMGIANGVTQTLFSPDAKLTRAQFCAFLIRTLGLEQKTSTVSEKLLFTDVKPGAWYTGYVNLAYSEGLIQGYGNGKFAPDANLKYEETLAMLMRMLGFTTAQIGNSWPNDYINYAHYLELDKNVDLSARALVSRGEAAILLYNALNTVPNRGSVEFYKTLTDVASIESAIILDCDCSENGREGQLKAYVPAYAGIKYYDKKHIVSDTFETGVADLMLDRSGDLLGVVLTDKKDQSVVVSSADLSGIRGKNGESVKIPASAKLIYGSDIYSWSSRGYSTADAASGKTAAIYKDNNGNVTYVVISAAGSDPDSNAAVAKTDSAATELRLALNAPANCAITKNNCAAGPEDLCAFDTAYYDAVSSTLRASDWSISGYIEKAQPGIASAETVVVSGCTLKVMECARDDLAKFTVGSKVTLLLTDDLKVAAAYACGEVRDSAVGLLNAGGTSITLLGSGLVISAPEINADSKLQGRLVTMNYSQNSISCRELEMTAPKSSDRLETATGVLHGEDRDLTLASYCSIFDQAGGSWLSSLEGTAFKASNDLDELTWTDKLLSAYISGYHVSSSGRIDILVLNDATGNLYTYGSCKLYTGSAGINLGSMTFAAYNDAAVVTNAGGAGRKALCVLFRLPDTYYGIAYRGSDSGNNYVCAKADLTEAAKLTASAFVLSGDDYYAKLGSSMIPVSENVQIYYKKNDRWESGTDALTAAVNSGLELTVYYDRTASTGGQVRIIELNN